MKRNTLITGIASAALLTLIGAQAGTIANYGDFEANDVWYNQVSEDTEYGAYNAPSITGNNLVFTPLGIDASANGGDMSNTAMLDFDIAAKSGQAIAGITFAENGNYSMSGFGTAEVDVTANFTITVLEVNGSPVNLVDNYSMTFNPNASGTFTHTLPSTGGLWNGSIFIDVGDILDSNSIVGDATLVNLSLENILYAESSAGTDALINKSSSNGLTITSDIIPEPASAVLLVSAGSFIGFIRRRFIG